MSFHTQEKKAPKKAPGTKQPASGNEQAKAQHSDLIEDAQLPPSKKAMPVGPADQNSETGLCQYALGSGHDGMPASSATLRKGGKCNTTHIADVPGGQSI